VGIAIRTVTSSESGFVGAAALVGRSDEVEGGDDGFARAGRIPNKRRVGTGCGVVGAVA
jgi:hypothetical protein